MAQAEALHVNGTHVIWRQLRRRCKALRERRPAENAAVVSALFLRAEDEAKKGLKKTNLFSEQNPSPFSGGLGRRDR
jgi:hypothetical protein